MRRSLLLSTLIFCVSLANAQTYFYIDAINVSPTNPTVSTAVSIDLEGGLSSTGAFVSSVSSEVIGTTVTISISAMDPGGATVIVPHTETLELGILAAGSYTIVIAGTNVGDFAAQGDHHFVVSGGLPCDSLDVISLQWHMFIDTLIAVHVSNMSMNELFNYPGFILFNDQGDTLAIEVVNFFGIGSDSWHMLQVRDGVSLPTLAFNGRLELWTWFTTDLVCFWEQPFDLCPPEPCVELYPTMQNFGGGLSIGDLDWTVYDTNGNLVGSGTWTMTETVQFVQDTICLAPGHYIMECAPQDPPTGGQPVFGMLAAGWISGPTQPVAWSLPNPLEFTVLEACIDGANGTPDIVDVAGPLVRVNGTTAMISNTSSNALGSIILYDALGKIILWKVENNNATTINLNGLATGVHILRIGAYTTRLVVGSN